MDDASSRDITCSLTHTTFFLLGGHITLESEQMQKVHGKPYNIYILLLILLTCICTNPCNHSDLPNSRKVCYESGPCGYSGNWLVNIPSCCHNYGQVYWFPCGELFDLESLSLSSLLYSALVLCPSLSSHSADLSTSLIITMAFGCESW